MILITGNRIRQVATALCIFAALAIVATPVQAGEDCVKLVFQGKLQGRIEDCGCPKAPYGGLERRAALLADIHNSCGAVIGIDAGNMVGPIEEGMRAQSAFLAAENARLGYGPAGIGVEDLHFGMDFLRELESKHGLQYTSANLRADGEPVFAPYLIQEAGGIRVGIISVLSQQLKLVSEAGDLPGVEVADPATALAEVLPTLRAQSDVIVLLANLPKQEARELARSLTGESGVNFMIEGDSSSHYGKALNIHGITLLAENARGKYLGEISLGIENGGWNGEFEYTAYNVDSREPGDKAMATRVREFLDSKTVAAGSK